MNKDTQSCKNYGTPRERLRSDLLQALEVMPSAVVYTPEGIQEQRAGCQYLMSHPELLPSDPEVRVWDQYISVPGNEHLRVRIYSPVQQAANLPGVLWLHGGGMAIGVPEADEGQNIRFAKEVPCVVVSVDYRLAPENPYPIPGNDCYEALCWFHQNSADLGVDPGRIAVAGMSGGGGLALSIALRARDIGSPAIAFLSLASPMISMNMDTNSAMQEYDPRTLNRQGVLDLWGYYLGEHIGDRDGYMEPLRGDYTGLPAVYTYAGELDPFREDTITLAGRLLSQSVPTELHIYPGCCHVFDAVAQHAAISQYAVSEVIRALREALTCNDEQL